MTGRPFATRYYPAMDPQARISPPTLYSYKSDIYSQTLVPFPPLATVEQIILQEKRGNCVPIYIQMPADLLTPVMAYLRISKDSRYSFLLESVIAGENIGRYSFIGAGKSFFFARCALRR